MSKEQVSSGYTRAQMAEHASKMLPAQRRAIVVGSEPGNIGEAITKDLIERREFRVFSPTRERLDAGDSLALAVLQGTADADTLVLCNGYTHLDWIEDQPSTEIRRAVHDSLTASMIATSAFVNLTANEPHRKTIIFVGSMAHRNVLNASAPYCAAKAGLHHFARCVGWELAPKGYNVYIVHPSNVEGTPMTEATIEGIMRYRGIDREEAEAYWGAINVQERWLTAGDVAMVVGDLAEEDGPYRWATGTAIELTGGQR